MKKNRNLSKKVDPDQINLLIRNHPDEVLNLINEFSTINGVFSEDLQQEIFLYVLEKNYRYDGSVGVGTFICAIAKQLAMNAYAKEQRNRKLTRKINEDRLYFLNHRYHYPAKDISEIIALIDRDTNPTRREILKRRFQDGQTLKSIASDMKTNIADVSANISLGLKILKEKLNVE